MPITLLRAPFEDGHLVRTKDHSKRNLQLEIYRDIQKRREKRLIPKSFERTKQDIGDEILAEYTKFEKTITAFWEQAYERAKETDKIVKHLKEEGFLRNFGQSLAQRASIVKEELPIYLQDLLIDLRYACLSVQTYSKGKRKHASELVRTKNGVCEEYDALRAMMTNASELNIGSLKRIRDCFCRGETLKFL